MFVAERSFISSLGGGSQSLAWSRLNAQIDPLINSMNYISAGQSLNINFISNKVVNGNNVTGLVFAPSSLPCVSDINNVCTGDYATDFSNIRNNYEIQQMKIAYDIDLVILLRARYSGNQTGYDGLSAQLNTSSLDRAHDAFGVAQLHFSPRSGDYHLYDNIRHELGHLLGGDHTVNNIKQPGTAPNTGFISTYNYQITTPAGINSYRTIMAYYSTCLRLHPSYSCIPAEGYSGLLPLYENSNLNYPIPNGNATSNNVDTMRLYAYYVSQYSDHIKPNYAPKGVITKTGSPTYFIGETITFDASKSTDANNDPITFRWELKDNQGNTLVTNSQPVAHQFTTSFSHAASYRIVLYASDNKGATSTTSLYFTVVPVTPILTSLERSLDFRVSWSTSPVADNYTIEQKIGTGSWHHYNTTTSTYFDKYLSAMTDNIPYSYRVKACNRGICGSLSNIITITDKQSGSGGGSCPPSGCKPCPSCQIP